MTKRVSYLAVTNVCLLSGVGSAFGFEWSGHPVWLVIGGTAAIVAITMYFVRHWERAPMRRVASGVTVGARPAGERVLSIAVPRLQAGVWSPWTAMGGIPGAMQQKVHARAMAEAKSPVVNWAVPKRDPAELALDIIKGLQAGKTTVAIHGDGRVVLEIETDVESEYRRMTVGRESPSAETVH